ncbi:MAG: NAD(P)/FAD-dependent oxidoreductase [Roseiflexaceae bacterium]|nr:NAD(P)/FAD-dependent oxidoreductase [Roseiflexaceae bacterium]
MNNQPTNNQPTVEVQTIQPTDYRTTEAPLAEATEYVITADEAPRTRPRVVIVGAGFGGLNAAQVLGNSEVDLLLIDRNNYHGFWPLLYQVATAGLEPEAITYPVRAILRKYSNTDFQLTEVRGIDMQRKLVLTDEKPVNYDYLILAAGSANNYFGNDALAQQTFGMKDVDEAARLRNHVLRTFERATREEDPAKRAALLTFVVIGGGPTGVELSGAFAELINHVMRKDYPMLDVTQARVVLVEAQPHILSTFPENLQRSALNRLKKMGVQPQLGKTVASVENDIVTFKDGEQIAAATVVWAAGVRASALSDALGVTLGRGARVKITPQLSLPDHPEVFVVGDMAYLEGYREGVAYPMVAQVAMQMGKQAAKNILAQVRGKQQAEFRYFDFGSMATIGRSAAVFDAFNIRLTGFLAWLGWLFVHILYLVGFRNRIVVLANWVINYFTYERGVRVITNDE